MHLSASLQQIVLTYKRPSFFCIFYSFQKPSTSIRSCRFSRSVCVSLSMPIVFLNENPLFFINNCAYKQIARKTRSIIHPFFFLSLSLSPFFLSVSYILDERKKKERKMLYNFNVIRTQQIIVILCVELSISSRSNVCQG